MKCIKCGNEIEEDEVCYQLKVGRIKNDEGSIYWEEAESVPIHGHYHIDCLE